MMVARGKKGGTREKGERKQEVQISSYKINKSQGYKVQHKKYSQ